ncbi:MAG: radical SAM family heme chaperone HemW [Bacteroidaceae bacterium]|nr:radical SAM family heme chaperone HemW [Bacteroidaceae bacterium]
MAGIYVHIPFCARRCIYCGFFSTVREEEAARYVNALCNEIRLRRDYLAGAPVTTVYLGGGTPSRLTPAQIGQVIDSIRSVCGLDSLTELTVECNPDDVTLDYMKALRALGVNRVSMGIQTFNDDLLRFLGRRHTSAQATDAVYTCRKAGMENISIDLMYGLPGQTFEIQQHDLDTATCLGVQHISSYCLSYEEGSVLERMRRDGRIIPADDETCAAMYTRMCNHLRSAGFNHYEISNFCSPGYHSRHNSSYWEGTPYIGIGAGAHSYDTRSRQWNPSDLYAYMTSIERGCPQFETESLSGTDIYNELIMLRLRTAGGLDISSLSPADRIYVMKASDNLISDGTLVLENSHIRIPETRMFISDAIISSLFR